MIKINLLRHDNSELITRMWFEKKSWRFRHQDHTAKIPFYEFDFTPKKPFWNWSDDQIDCYVANLERLCIEQIERGIEKFEKNGDI